MKIVLPLVSAAKGISGVQRHAINAAASMLQESGITRVHLIAGAWQRYVLQALPPAIKDDSRLVVEFIAGASSTIARNYWYYAQLPALARACRADIVHLAYPMPVNRSAYQASVVVTLHDLYPYDLPENFGFPKVFFNRTILRSCLRAADAIACVSESTRLRLTVHDPAVLPKSVVIPNAVEPSAALPVVPAPLGCHDEFLLCIAQHRRNKNILLLLQAFVRLIASGDLAPHARVVIVGIDGPETPAIHRFLRRHNLHGQVVLVAGLSEGELQWCYRNCSVLVAPSSVEGFGLPVAEGLLAGCRIVCSDIPAHREVGNPSCTYVNLAGDAVAHLAEAIAQRLASPGPAPAALPQLAAKAVGRQYTRLYRSLRSEWNTAPTTHGREAVHSNERELKA